MEGITQIEGKQIERRSGQHKPGAKVTFEVLLSSFGLESDSALERIGALIHYLDVDGVPAADAAGIEALLRGAQAMLSDDDRLLSEAGKVFDFLYACYGAEQSG
jgi:hypothetical protein